MIYPPFKLTSYSVWLRCAPCDDAQGKKTFWADIVLYVKAHQGKSVFFEELIRKVCWQDEAQECIKLPLHLLVDSLVRAGASFDYELWSAVIDEWTKIKLDLKIKAQTVILQNDDIIGKFLLAILGKSKNPRPLVRQIAKESGLLKDYAKSDVIMMLCSIVAESLKYQMDVKEKGNFMQDGVFQMEEEKDEVFAAREELLAVQFEPAQCSFAANDKSKELQTLWEMFLSEFAEVSPLDECWQETELYVAEVQAIAAKKLQEREEIVRRSRLLGDFKAKADCLSDVFRVQFNELDIAVPESSAAETFDNVCLEHGAQLMSNLQQVLQKYKELSSSKKASLAEEKKRIGQLFTVMTDIENIVGQLGEVCASVFANGAEAEPAVAQPVVEEEFSAPEVTEESGKLENGEEGLAEAAAAQEQVEEEQAKDDEEQIELFLGK